MNPGEKQGQILDDVISRFTYKPGYRLMVHVDKLSHPWRWLVVVGVWMDLGGSEYAITRAVPLSLKSKKDAVRFVSQLVHDFERGLVDSWLRFDGALVKGETSEQED